MIAAVNSVQQERAMRETYQKRCGGRSHLTSGCGGETITALIGGNRFMP